MTNCETFKCAACGNVRDAVVLSVKDSTCKACWRAEIDLKQNGHQDRAIYEGDHAPTGWHDDEQFDD